MAAYRSRMQTALESLDAAHMQDDWRANNRSILQNNIAFMDSCLAEGVTIDALQEFAKKQRPLLKKNIALGSANPGGPLDGGDWRMEGNARGPTGIKPTPSATASMSTRQNNILFSVLAQYMGPEAINDRLFLTETTSFTTTPEDMLELLTRIVADRSVGAAFFGNYYMMDYELMGGDARQAIIDEDAKRNINPTLPPLVPWGSHQFPNLVTPGSGPKTWQTFHELKHSDRSQAPGLG